ncbi:50S ribosomal protein L25/general stress protein Ctc [Caldifermentibacillus hisashii]|uniref:50S ribosomal protein L25/general stress protein Ctc n=1 Tax=Caldifermentibacillus hisashii TaxID=996558 RepID=UPI0031B6C9BC
MEVVLYAQERSKATRAIMNSLRENGNIPAILYGKNVSNTPISVEKLDFKKQMNEIGKNGIFTIDVDGKRQQAIVRNYEVDPITRDIIHIDFLAVNSLTVITADVRIFLVNEAEGVKDGGVLQQSMFDLSVTTNVNRLPDAIEVDVTHLQVGETITVGKVRQQYPFEINHEDDEVIASILPPRQEEEISTGEEQEPGIPENLEGREE